MTVIKVIQQNKLKGLSYIGTHQSRPSKKALFCVVDNCMTKKGAKYSILYQHSDRRKIDDFLREKGIIE